VKRLKGETFYHELLRKVSFYLVNNWIGKFPVTPNQITIFRNVLVLISFYLFLRLDYWYILGFVLFQFYELLDSVDGDLARYKNLKSKLGVWLEIFFDAIISPVWGLLGLLFAYISYKISNEWIYFIFWGIIGFSVNLEKTFYIHFKGCKSELEEAKHGHIYFGIIGKPFKEKIKNFLIISKSWENQWLIFTGLIYVLFKINLFFYVWIWLIMLNQIHWIRLAWYGYEKAR